MCHFIGGGAGAASTSATYMLHKTKWSKMEKSGTIYKCVTMTNVNVNYGFSVLVIPATINK